MSLIWKILVVLAVIATGVVVFVGYVFFQMLPDGPPYSAVARAIDDNQLQTVINLVPDQTAARTPLPSGRPYHGCSLLAYAASRNRDEIIEHLLSCKADVNQPDDLGRSPLMTALTNNTQRLPASILQRLLDADADVILRDRWGESALHLAAKFGNHEACAQFIRSGASTSAANNLGMTPLHSALTHYAPTVDYNETIAVLVRNGADLDAADKFGRTPRTLALPRNIKLETETAKKR